VGRHLGQHFLTDPAILDRIIDGLDPKSDDVVVEIGPGKGSMTRRLVPRVGRVIAIERDRELAEELRARGREKGEQGTVGNLTVVQGDALEVDWHREVNALSDSSSRIVDLESQTPVPLLGNVPYYITSPLIDKALKPPRPQVIVYLIQREVADRLAALPGGKTYGALTVGVQAVAQVERLFVVRPGSFNPPPKVDSAVVRITPRSEPLVADANIADFRRFTTGLFSQRRKQLKRVLRSVADVDTAQAEAKLSELDLNPTARPEELAPNALVRLYESMKRSGTV
jgi:16S rRNA (adenine1518-N6/adenine1519-N6)-dimethyltransferase